MSTEAVKKMFTRLSMAALILLSQADAVRGQYTENKQEALKPDLSQSAPDVRGAYPLFKSKCGECHTLDRSLKASLSSAQWSTVVKQMQAMASAHISDNDAQKITAFLTVVAGERAKGPEAAAPADVSDPVGAGKQFYAAQNCAMCHNIAGEGGGIGPSLTGVGARLSHEQLLSVIHGMGHTGSSMPALPAGTTDKQLNNLALFLQSLR